MFVSCMLIAQVKLGLKNSKIRWGKEEEKEKNILKGYFIYFKYINLEEYI